MDTFSLFLTTSEFDRTPRIPTAVAPSVEVKVIMQTQPKI